jgi:hypothetical protein
MSTLSNLFLEELRGWVYLLQNKRKLAKGKSKLAIKVLLFQIEI